AGCVQSVLFGGVNAAALRVLSRNGARVETPPGQTCCGALQGHGGDREGAQGLARRNLRAFDPDAVDAIVVTASGCGSILCEYGDLLRDDPELAGRARAFSAKVVDISKFLADAGPRPARLERPLRATYHEPCHLAHALKVRKEPRAVLRSIEGLELVELVESDWCCGSAGSYNLTQPELSARLLERKLDRIAETGAQVVVTGNPGCLIQIAAGARERGMDLRVVHPVALLDEAYRGVAS
ncbi:MAG: (Fe-S)-binding protein, partial [Nitrospinota bacterium]